MTGSEVIPIIHYIVTGILGIATIVQSIRKDRSTKDAVCQQEFQNLKIQVAVLETKVENELHLLEKLDQKLDKLNE